MKKYRIFVSGAQKELKQERLAIKKLVLKNRLLKKHFDVFLFEDLPARSIPTSKIYLNEVDESDIYLGIFGLRYGQKGADILSPTEREFRRAVKKDKEILVFLKGGDDSVREKKLGDLIKEIKEPDSGYKYKRFETLPDLEEHVFDSLVVFLEEKGVISKPSFDSMVCRDAAYKDINEELVKDFLENRAIKRKVEIPKISIRDFLVKTIKVVKVEDGILKPINAAVLFFCDNPQDFIPQSTVKIARFKGTTRIEFIDSQELTGPFYKILDDLENFFRRNTRLASKIVEFKRIDIPEYPFEAIHEGTVNAIAHRDYFRSGSNIQIDIFDDRIEITSPGELLSGLDIKHLEGVHETRNKGICKIFHETKDMERYGTGITKMKNWMRTHGLKPPAITQPGDFFRITFHGPGDKILDLVPSIPKERQTDLRELGLNERQIEALRLMLNEGKKMTIKVYTNLFNISDKTAKRDMKKLVKTGFVAKIGYKKGAYFKA